MGGRASPPCCTRSAAARSQIASWIHFALVATGALVAGVASVGLTIAGARANDGRTVLLGAAFSTMTALLAIHGLATPGIIVGQNGVIALAGAASLPAGGAVLALTAVPAMRRPLRMGPVLALQAALAVAILLLGAIGLLFPAAVPGVPQAGSAARARAARLRRSPSTGCWRCAPSAPTR